MLRSSRVSLCRGPSCSWDLSTGGRDWGLVDRYLQAFFDRSLRPVSSYGRGKADLLRQRLLRAA